MRNIAKDIRAFNDGRIPFLLDLKYARMNEDAFRFFRGTSHLYYSDLNKKLPVHDPTKVWICGDLHLENFGSFKGDNRQVYFDMNDFDDGGMASCSVEITRTLVSIHLAGDRIAFSKTDRNSCAEHFLKRYSEVLAEGRSLMVDAATANGVVGKLLRDLQKRKRSEFIASRTVIHKGKRCLNTDHTRAWEMTANEKKEILQFFQKNPVFLGAKKITVTDAAHRIAGTGSLGIHRYVLFAHQQLKPHKHYLLELKESRPSAINKSKHFPQPEWKNNAERITTIQKRMQCVSPALLSRISFGGRHFVLKELQPTDDRVELESCRGNVSKFKDLL
ncbi:MAG TPA: DUF2252 family protein, partial [Bacteroidia bacterium]|nr:DUF2252 family protein [Bacteroidia bacterium]